MALHRSGMEAVGFTSLPYEITETIVQPLSLEDLKNLTCVSRTVHQNTADILRRRIQALILQYHCLNIDVVWTKPTSHDCFGWDRVRARPISSLCSILENVNQDGHFVREISYTPDSNSKTTRWEWFDGDEKEIMSPGEALKTAQNIEVLRDYLQKNQLGDDRTQSKLLYQRSSSDPRADWDELFVKDIKIDYGLFLRILLPMVPYLTSLEISWNFPDNSEICTFIRAASKDPNPFLQHLTKVKLLLGRRPHRMDILAFLTVPSLRWLSIHSLRELDPFSRYQCDPEAVVRSKLTRLELVDCSLCDENLCSYLSMFSSLQHVHILMTKTCGEILRDPEERITQAIDTLFAHCGSSLGFLSMLNIGREERLKSLEKFPVLRHLSLQFSSLFSLDDREPQMISQLSGSVQTLRLWNDLTKRESEIQNRIELLGPAKSDGDLSLRRVEVATAYTSLEHLQRWQLCIEEYLAAYDISFAFLEKEQWPHGNGREPLEPRVLANWRRFFKES